MRLSPIRSLRLRSALGLILVAGCASAQEAAVTAPDDVRAFQDMEVATTLPLPYGPNLTHEQATAAIDAGIAYARENGWAVSVAVVDTAGQVVAIERLDDAHRASVAFATEKAESAAMLKRSTKIFSDALAGGRMALLGFTDLHVHSAEGGEVIVVDGRIVGAVGAAGVTQEQDREIALAGADAVAGR